MRFILFIFFSLISLISHCNPVIDYPDKDYGANWYTDSDGLPQNTIKQIFPDVYGFIWLLTENGLVRYDGRNFRVFNSGNTSVNNNRMIHAERNNGNDSILVYNDLNETLLISKRIAKTFQSNSPPAFCLPDGTPGAGSPNFSCRPGNSYKVPAQKGHYFSVGNDTVIYHTGDQNGYKIHFPYNDLRRFFALGDTLYYLDHTGKYTAVHNGRLFHGELKIPVGEIAGIIYNTIARQTFIHNGKNLYLLEKRDGRLFPKQILEGFDFSPENSILSAFYDSSLRHTYLGSATRGLCLVKNYGFKSVNTPGTKRVQYASTIYGADSIITASGAIISVDSPEGRKTEFPWKSDRFSIAIDDYGDIWTKDYNLLYRYKKEESYREYDQWELPQKIEQLYKGTDGKIWIAMHHNPKKRVPSAGTLYYMEPSSGHDYPEKYGTFDFSICYMLQTSDRTLWLGSFDGLYKLDLLEKKVESIPGLQSGYIRSLYAPNPDEIWVTTSADGIFLYKDRKLTRFPADRKGYMFSSHCMLEDGQGYLWITTNKGLFQVSKNKMMDYALGKSGQVYYHYYDKKSGFLSNEFNGGCEPCATKLASGHITLPSLNGMVVFNPEKLSPTLPTGRIYIDEVRAGNRILPADRDTIVLERNFGRVHISMATPFYGNPYNLNMEFKLEDEKNKDWEPIEDGQPITFSYLPPGEHTLTIRKLNSFYSHYSHKRITLIVRPHFWETGWFSFLLYLLIPIIIYYIVKLRMRYVRYKNALLKKKIVESTRNLRNTIRALRITKDKLKQQTAIQEKLIAAISHDIRSPLRFMVDTGEYLYTNFEKGNKKMIHEGIRSMYRASGKIHDFICELLDYSKARIYEGSHTPPDEHYSLQALVREKTELFMEIATTKKTGILNRVPYGIHISLNRHLLSIIIHNILDNAVKNTYNGKITISAFTSDNKLYIIMEDTGRGIPENELRYYQSLFNPGNDSDTSPDAPNNSLGVKIIMDLLIILNGHAAIESDLNQGTKVTLTFVLQTATDDLAIY